MPTFFSERDLEILEILSSRVRFLSLDQIARVWWRGLAHPKSGARHRMKRLERQGWVEIIPLLSRPEIPIAGPVLEWSLKDPDPNMAAVSYRLNTRWTDPVRSMAAVIATERTALEFGGRAGRIPRSTEQTHDLHLTAVYLFKREHTPREAKRWIVEDLFPPHQKEPGEKVPDAIIWGRKKKAIEWGGEYSKRKLEVFHSFCKQRNYEYEIW